MYNNTPTINKARTILMSNGIRINLRNIAYLEVQDSDDEDMFTFIIKWKYKASILKETIQLAKRDVKLANYLKQYNLIELYDGCYVNLSRIMLIEEKTIHGPEVKILVRMVFLEGFEIIKKLPAVRWQSWKSLYA